jgi:hypothetical protein
MRLVLRISLLAVLAFSARQLWLRQAMLREAGAELEDQRSVLTNDEDELTAIDRQIDESAARVADLHAAITATERGHPDGVPAAAHEEYRRVVAEHNDAVAEHNALVARYNTLRGEYGTRVERHNARVTEANDAVSAGGRCVVLPTWLAAYVCE